MFEINHSLLLNHYILCKGSHHSAFKMDVSKSDSVSNVVEKIMKVYNEPPTIIVNCAGITMDNFLVNMTEDCFNKVIDVNLKVNYI